MSLLSLTLLYLKCSIRRGLLHKTMKDKRRILILEDDDMLGEMIKALLSIRNFEVYVLKDSSRMVEVVLQHAVQLILLDKVLQAEDGLEICQFLKKNHATAHIPVMIMSGHHNIMTECFAAGADQFIAKPFDMKLFLERIESMWAARTLK